MKNGPRLLVILNGLTAVACVLHVLVHAIGLSVGAWHDYLLYALVAVSFLVSLASFRQVQRSPLATA